jgi:hypothetical protein
LRVCSPTRFSRKRKDRAEKKLIIGERARKKHMLSEMAYPICVQSNKKGSKHEKGCKSDVITVRSKLVDEEARKIIKRSISTPENPKRTSLIHQDKPNKLPIADPKRINKNHNPNEKRDTVEVLLRS